MSTKIVPRSKTPPLEYDDSFESDDSYKKNKDHDRSKSVSPKFKSRSESRNSLKKEHEFKEKFGSVRDVKSPSIEKRPKSVDSYKYRSDSSEIRSISSSPSESFDRSRESFDRKDFKHNHSNEIKRPKSEVIPRVDKYEKRISPDRGFNTKLERERSPKRDFNIKDEFGLRERGVSPKGWKEPPRGIDRFGGKDIDDKEFRDKTIRDRDRLEFRDYNSSNKEKRLSNIDKEDDRDFWKKPSSPAGSRSPSDRQSSKTFKDTMFQEERPDKMKHLNRMNLNQKSLDNIEEESERRLTPKRLEENRIKSMSHYDPSPRRNGANLGLAKPNRLDFRETDKSFSPSRRRNGEFEKGI